MRRVAIVGAGVSGLTAAWRLTRPGEEQVQVTLYEATERVGGIVRTIRRDGFIVELGPDSWVSEKPAAGALVAELGLAQELIVSKDATRKTYLWLNGELQAMPDGLRMMVPTSRAALEAIDASAMFSATARQAFREELARAEELQRTAPIEDESIASFTARHFGREVLERLAAPLLSGVFGGDVETLSVRAVMAPFVAMERERGSLIAALEERDAERRATGQPAKAIFTTLRPGLSTLTDGLAAALPRGVLRPGRQVVHVRRSDLATHTGWTVRHKATSEAGVTSVAVEDEFDELVLATPGHVTAELLRPIDRELSRLLPTEASSAILVALGWTEAPIDLPEGFGFLVPARQGGERRGAELLAGTFVDQKFPDRVPQGGRLVRAFFGGESARDLLAANCSDDDITTLALGELNRILGRGDRGVLPPPRFAYVQRWPLSLPQYKVGHLERMAALERRVASIAGLHLLGNAFRGVGLADLIREAQTLAHELCEEATGF